MVTTPSPNPTFARTCPMRQMLDLIADRWTTLIFGILADGPHRFSELQREIEGISQKMLSQTLRELERSGLITRTVYPETPIRVEYALTALGQTFVPTIAAIQNWAETHIDEVRAAQTAYDARHAGAKADVQAAGVG